MAERWRKWRHRSRSTTIDVHPAKAGPFGGLQPVLGSALLRLLPFPHPFRATIIFFVGMALRMPWRQKKLIVGATVLFLATLVVLLVVPACLKGHPQETLVHRLLDLLMVFVTLCSCSVWAHRWVVGAGGVVFLLHVVDLFVEGPPWFGSISEVGMVLLFFLAIARMFQVLVLGGEGGCGNGAVHHLRLPLPRLRVRHLLHRAGSASGFVPWTRWGGQQAGPLLLQLRDVEHPGLWGCGPRATRGRSLAVLTAVIGQMYIALVMAMVVASSFAGYKEEDSASEANADAHAEEGLPTVGAVRVLQHVPQHLDEHRGPNRPARRSHRRPAGTAPTGGRSNHRNG